MTAHTLRDLADLSEALDALLAETGGELTPELEAHFDALDVSSNEKIERVALYIVEQLSQAAALKEEEARIKARRVAREKSAASLSLYLEHQMQRLGKDKVNGLLCTVAMQMNPPKLVEMVKTDAEDLRLWRDRDGLMDYVRYTETFALDKEAIKQALKAGTAPPEVAQRFQLVQEQSLRIK